MAHAGVVEGKAKGKRPYDARNGAKQSRDFSHGRTRQQPSKPTKTKPANAAAKLIVEPRPDWHATPLAALQTTATPSKPVPAALIETFHEHARGLLERDAAAYAETHVKTSSSYNFMSTIMASGTWGDKVSALTLVVQESPLHTARPLEQLMGLAGKRGREQALTALAAVKDLLSQGALLPADRKLRHFSKQPGLLTALQGLKASYVPHDVLPGGLTTQHLLLWAYEDRLKELYFSLLQSLEGWCNDEVEFSRARALSAAFELLRDRPEQEENLLRLLVNKLGDTSKKIASRASFLLLQLQTTHPSMKMIIVDAIEADIILRPGQSANAKYYAVITLNQTVLQSGDAEVPNKLLDVYFGLFVATLNRQQKARQGPDEKELKSSLGNESKRKLARAAALATAAKADEELQEKITAQVLTGINRAFPFSKKEGGAFDKHLDTMFRITHSSNFNTTVQALTLIQQISAAHQISGDRYLRTLYQSLLDPRLVRSSKQTMYLNLLYRSLKADASIRRVKAFVKRLLQILTLHEPPFICAALYLVIELRRLFPGLRSMLDIPEHDEVISDDDADPVPGVATDLPAPDPTDKGRSSPSTYDGRKRDPEYSNADRTCLWELLPWLHHHHPSVTLFANHLLLANVDKASTPAKPDPASHTLSHFLDRLAYRNPKTKDTAGLRGQSLMQPALANSNAADSLLSASRRANGDAHVALNSEAFWQRRAEDVREDEVFFHRYFGLANAGRPSKKNKGWAATADGDVDDDDEVDIAEEEADAGDEGFDEDEVWKAIVGSKGGENVGGGDDDDFDDDDLGFDDEDLADDDDTEVDDALGEQNGGVELGDGLDDVADLLRGGGDATGDGATDAGGEDEEDDDGEALDLEAGGGGADDEDSDWGFSSDDSREQDKTRARRKRKGEPETAAPGKRRKEASAADARAYVLERRAREEGASRDEAGARARGPRRRRAARLALPTFAAADEWAGVLAAGGGGSGEDEDDE